MDANTLTPAELRALADKKEQESIPVKEGFLKFDLHSFHEQYSGFAPGKYQIFQKHNFWLFTDKEKAEIIKDFTERFTKVLNKGDRFVCFLEDGRETWYDDEGYGVEAMDTDWANKYLENIKAL